VPKSTNESWCITALEPVARTGQMSALAAAGGVTSRRCGLLPNLLWAIVNNY